MTAAQAHENVQLRARIDALEAALAAQKQATSDVLDREAKLLVQLADLQIHAESLEYDLDNLE